MSQMMMCAPSFAMAMVAQALRPTRDKGYIVFEFHKGLLILDLKDG
ncbi:MAG: hypothetical protein WAL59_05505 [Roseiarcus sp.]